MARVASALATVAARKEGRQKNKRRRRGSRRVMMMMRIGLIVGVLGYLSLGVQAFLVKGTGGVRPAIGGGSSSSGSNSNNHHHDTSFISHHPSSSTTSSIYRIISSIASSTQTPKRASILAGMPGSRVGSNKRRDGDNNPYNNEHGGGGGNGQGRSSSTSWPPKGDMTDVTELRNVEDMLHHSLGGRLNTTACHGALQACARLHQPDKAAWIIKEMRRVGPPPDRKCYSSAIETCARKGHWTTADQLLQNMREDDLIPEPQSYAHLMSACHRAGESQRVLDLLKELERSQGVDVPVSAYVTAIHAAIADKQYNLMLQAAESMLDRGMEVEDRLIQSMLSDLVKDGRWEISKSVLDLARSAGKLNVEAYTRAIESCVPEGAWEEAMRLLETMEQDGFEIGMGAYRAAMSACRGAGDIERVFEVLDFMDEREVVPEAELYSLAFAACFEQESWDVVPFLLNCMERHGLKPDSAFFNELVRVLAGSGRRPQNLAPQISALRQAPGTSARAMASCTTSLLVVFNTAIHACAAAGDWRLALDLLRQLKEDGLRPDYYSYQAAMAACQRAGEWEKVLTVLQQMESVGYPPDLASYDIVMSACIRSKSWKRVPDILKRMDESGVQPDAHFIEVVMKAVAGEGQWNIALIILKFLEGKQMMKNVVYNLAIKACDAGGEWKAAVKLVEEMKKKGMRPDLYSFNTAIAACQKTGQAHQITRLLSRMDDLRVQPNTYTFIMATTACLQAPTFDKLFEVFAAMERTGIDPDDRFFRVLMQKFSKERQWREAIHLLHVIRKMGRASQLYTRMTIETCANAGEWKTAGYLLVETRREGQTPDAVSYAIAMSACLKAGEKARVLGLLDEMVALKVEPCKEAYSLAMAAALDMRDWDRIDVLMDGLNDATFQVDQKFFSDMMASFASSGRWTSALNLLRVMGEGDKLSAGFYEQAVQACAVAGEIEMTLQILVEMIDMGFTPSTFIFNLAMEACTKLGDLNGVLGLKRRMQQNNVEFDVVSCNILLNAFAICGKWDEALSLLQRMPTLYGVRPNLVSFNTALKACAMGRRWREAMLLLSNMHAQDVTPDAVSYRTAMNACIEGGDAANALKIFDKMRDDGLGWDTPTYNIVLKACAETRQPEKAWELFQQMQSSGLQPELKTYTTLMNAWVEDGQCDRALSTFTDMRAAGLKLDNFALTVAIKACRVCGLLSQALEYVEEALILHPIEPVEAITFNKAMQVCEDHGAMEDALNLYARMQEEGVEPNWITYTTIFRILVEEQRWDDVKDLLKQVEKQIMLAGHTSSQLQQEQHPLSSSSTQAPPPSSSPSINLKSSESFFIDSMRKAISLKAWEVVQSLFALVTLPEIRKVLTGLKCNILFYGGAVAAARRLKRPEEEARFIEIMATTAALIADRQDYKAVVNECDETGDWLPLIEYFLPPPRPLKGASEDGGGRIHYRRNGHHNGHRHHNSSSHQHQQQHPYHRDHPNQESSEGRPIHGEGRNMWR